MSNKKIGKLNSRSSERMSLRVNRPQYFTTRQYVAKLDQIMCSLELDHILFPTNAPKEIRRDFDATMDCAKKSINNLKQRLFKLSTYTKPSHLSMTKIRSRKRRSDTRLFPNKLVKVSQNPSEIETIDITKDVPDIIMVTEPEARAELSLAKEAALSLLSLKGNNETPVEQTNPLSDKSVEPAPSTGLSTPGYYKSGNKIYKLHTTQSISSWRKRIASINPISPGFSSLSNTRVTEPCLYLYTKPTVADMQKLASTETVVDMNGISYAVAEVDFEVLPSITTNDD